MELNLFKLNGIYILSVAEISEIKRVKNFYFK